MGAELLDDEGLNRALGELDGWSPCDGKLCRDLEFVDFRAAFGFLTQVALIAERQDHHPEMRIVYRVVELRLTTHSAGGLTERDVRMARAIDMIPRGSL
jgi:4a-hydroxytetrahydrobiopterin dehydratase